MATDTHRRMYYTLVCHLVGDADRPDLTQRQMATFLTIYSHPPDQFSVKHIAEILGVARPVVTRALDTLSRWEFIKRWENPLDRREIIVGQTQPGRAYFDYITEVANRAAAAPLLP